MLLRVTWLLGLTRSCLLVSPGGLPYYVLWGVLLELPIDCVRFPAVWVVCRSVSSGLCLVAGEGLVLVRIVYACLVVCVGLHSGATLVDVHLDVVPLQPRFSSQSVAGCLLGGLSDGRDLWGGDRVVGGVLPRINIGTDVWGESSIMTGVYQH